MNANFFKVTCHFSSLYLALLELNYNRQSYLQNGTAGGNATGCWLKYLRLLGFLLLYLGFQLFVTVPEIIAQDFLPNSEPILGEIHSDLVLTPDKPETTGKLQIYQILRLQLSKPQLYEAIELELEPWPNNSAKTQPVSLLIYSQVEALENAAPQDNANFLYRGLRLLTRGIAGELLFRLTLAKGSDSLSKLGSELPPDPTSNPYQQGHGKLGRNDSSYSNEYNSQNISLETKNFPIYIVLYPFQPNPSGPATETKTDEDLTPSYQYKVHVVKKDFGVVRFRLLPPQASVSKQGNQVNYLDNPNLYLNIQIDERNYDWAFDASYSLEAGTNPNDNQNDLEFSSSSSSSSPRPPTERSGKARYSQPYQVGLGYHKVQISNQEYYVHTEFQLDAGESKVVDLQLRERLSQLLLVVPQNAVLLLDGIPLRSQQRWTPTWQNVEIEELETYHYELPRLQYRLAVPAGEHHLLVQYEGNTWQRKLYCQEGDEQYLQLNWELSSR